MRSSGSVRRDISEMPKTLILRSIHYPACAVAPGCLWAPSVLLLPWCTVHRHAALNERCRRFPSYMEALFARRYGTYTVPSENKITLPWALLISGNYRYRENPSPYIYIRVCVTFGLPGMPYVLHELVQPRHGRGVDGLAMPRSITPGWCVFWHDLVDTTVFLLYQPTGLIASLLLLYPGDVIDPTSRNVEKGMTRNTWFVGAD